MLVTTKEAVWANVLFLIIYLAAMSRCDELDDLVSKIESEISKAQSYKRRTDNSDIFTEVLTESSTDFGQFDFIVVGGGSAGAIVAKRLSESRFRVLLLEAGVEKYDISDIPGLYSICQLNDVNWGYHSAPQKFICFGMNNNQCPVPRGKFLGGSSSLNNMFYARGNSYDQDAWKEFGVSGWSWNETLPYFKKLENYERIYGDPGYHGMDGPIHLDYARPNHLLDNVFLNANAEIYQLTKDYNGNLQMAAGKVQINTKNAKRESTSKAYLGDYDKRFLTIETSAFVHKIIFRDNRAIGVEYIKDNQENLKAFAEKEVIISGGALNSPQILMLSGIGPKEELTKHNIPIIADLPVGKNLVDHVIFVGLIFDSTLLITDKDKTLRDHAFDYLSEVGILTSTGVNSLSFISTEGNSSYPDIEIIINASGRPFLMLPNSQNFKQETVDTLAQIDLNKLDYSFRIRSILLHPKSKGTITLKSKSPVDFPVIDFNSFSDPDDVDRIYKSLVYIKKLLNTNAFRQINAKLIKTVLPACKDFEYDSKDFWICTIRHLSFPSYHSTGTCIMGQKGSSVVDSKLAVHGVKGLRVVDLSVAPKLNSGHSNALAMMIGEKAADIIKSDY